MKTYRSWISFLTLHVLVRAYDTESRWGQATFVINNVLFVHGGKIDPDNEYSYSSAPNTNDILFLSLSESFSASTPPWELVSSSANSSSSQGPALAWHTLSAYNSSQALLFGGQPGPNSPTVIVDLDDSAIILDFFNRREPDWKQEAKSWAGQPARRIYHSAVTDKFGHVYIFGGEKADGSDNDFPLHYVLDPFIPSFISLPTENGPPDLYGHVSIILSDGRILIFGGRSQSLGGLIPLSLIWSLDTTQSTLSWTKLSVSDSFLPSPRRAFVAVLIGDGKILIHGGSDAALENNLDDGWILDTNQNPVTWTQVPALSQLGARRDHFAVSYGQQVIFGFGYGNNGPLPPSLQVYDTSSDSFLPTFTPPPSTATITQTLPLPSSTGTHTPPSTITKGSGFTTTNVGVHPTTTLSNDPNGGPGRGNNDSSDHKNIAAIAIGSALGALGLIVVGIAFMFVVRHKTKAREQARFTALHNDDGDSPHLGSHIPFAGSANEKSQHSNHAWSMGVLVGLAGTIGAVVKSRNPRVIQQRRDMLADEDTRDFGEWSDSRRKDGTGSSSWSLRTILSKRMRSREPSTLSTSGASPWPEKTDPFSDDASLRLMEDGEAGYTGIAGTSRRPQGRRETSYTSTRSGLSYVDPFSDRILEERREGSVASLLDDDSQTGEQGLPHLTPFSSLRIVPPVTSGGHPLSPLSEHTSQNTLSLHDPPSLSSHGHSSSDNTSSPYDSSLSRVTSMTSVEPPRSPPLTSSIIGGYSPQNQPMRRSNSWWSRFSRSGFLDRRISDASRQHGRYDIRDPNPPPRLVPIEESAHSVSPDRISPGSHHSNSAGQGQTASRKTSKVYGGHGKSMSSLRTADSEAIERMAGAMDVVQRVRTGSHRTSGSTSSTGGLSIDTHLIDGATLHGASAMYTSPVEMTLADAASYPLRPLSTSPSVAPSPAITPPDKITASSSGASLGSSTSSRPSRPPSGGAIAAHVQAYERRLSQEQDLPTLTNTRQREVRPKKNKGVSVDYGLVPKQSLFVANPDLKAFQPSQSS